MIISQAGKEGAFPQQPQHGARPGPAGSAISRLTFPLQSPHDQEWQSPEAETSLLGGLAH